MCTTDALFGCMSNQAILRSQMQHKCVEMSLQITTGLAAGVFALMFTKSADPSAFNHATKVCFVIVVDLYTILQLLILANYLFHTFLGIINWRGPHELSQELSKAFSEKLLQEQKPPTQSQKARAAILNVFQPLIIYSSTLIGFLACFVLALWLFWPIRSCLDWFFVIIPIFFLLALFILGGFHIKIEKLANCWSWVIMKREDKSLLHLVRNWVKHAP